MGLVAVRFGLIDQLDPTNRSLVFPGGFPARHRDLMSAAAAGGRQALCAGGSQTSVCVCLSVCVRGEQRGCRL